MKILHILFVVCTIPFLSNGFLHLCLMLFLGLWQSLVQKKVVSSGVPSFKTEIFDEISKQYFYVLGVCLVHTLKFKTLEKQVLMGLNFLDIGL